MLFNVMLNIEEIEILEEYSGDILMLKYFNLINKEGMLLFLFISLYLYYYIKLYTILVYTAVAVSQPSSNYLI